MSTIPDEEFRRTYELLRGKVLPVFEELKAEGKSDDEVVVFWENAVAAASLPNPRDFLSSVLIILRFEGHLGTIARDVDLTIQGSFQRVYQQSDPFMKGTSSLKFPYS